MLRRRLLGGKKIQIPNGVYAVAGNYSSSYNLYRYSDEIPWNAKLVAFFIKETTTCFIIYVDIDRNGYAITDENTVRSVKGYYYPFYTSREECLTHVSSNGPSLYLRDYNNGAVPEQAVAADVLLNMSTYTRRLHFAESNTYVPTIGDLEIIYNRLDDILKLYREINKWNRNDDTSGICGLYSDSYVVVNGKFQHVYNPSWWKWTVQTGTPSSKTTYWEYGFSGETPSNRIIGVWPYNSGMAHILRIYYPLIHELGLEKYYYRGYQLTKDTWGTDDVGYVP